VLLVLRERLQVLVLRKRLLGCFGPLVAGGHGGGGIDAERRGWCSDAEQGVVVVERERAHGSRHAGLLCLRVLNLCSASVELPPLAPAEFRRHSY
jgi:hypothetical protein